MSRGGRGWTGGAGKSAPGYIRAGRGRVSAIARERFFYSASIFRRGSAGFFAARNVSAFACKYFSERTDSPIKYARREPRAFITV